MRRHRKEVRPRLLRNKRILNSIREAPSLRTTSTRCARKYPSWLKNERPRSTRIENTRRLRHRRHNGRNPTVTVERRSSGSKFGRWSTVRFDSNLWLGSSKMKANYEFIASIYQKVSIVRRMTGAAKARVELPIDNIVIILHYRLPTRLVFWYSTSSSHSWHWHLLALAIL